jgi:gamma-glutamyltranspeptidase/glutathione hydrolase
LNVLVFGMDPQQAVEAPRFSSQSMVNSFYPRVYLPGRLSVEPGIHGDVRSDLAALGHKVVGVEACGYGAVVNQREPQTGALSAGADPRVATYAIGY